jgi:16S rRNA pseudouridine516 synthase
MNLQQILHSQGFGTRRICLGLIQSGEVSVDGETVTDPDRVFQTDKLLFTVQGQTWPFQRHALVMLHKPAGFECSMKPSHHPSVMSLLPSPLRTRGVQPVGRLDEDTTGLLLLTDDGPLIHRLTSPKHHVPKVYEVTAKHPVTEDQRLALLAGVTLKDDPRPARALAADIVSPTHLRLTIAEGRYHQVKRMLAAVGNRCELLHRSAFGSLQLPTDLAVGRWAWVTMPVAG